MEKYAGYLFAAFAIVWAVVFGYMLVLLSKQRKLQQEINSLKEALKEKNKVSSLGFIPVARNIFKSGHCQNPNPYVMI